MSILVLAEHDHKSIKPVTLNIITAARKIDSDVHVLVAGTDCTDAANAASNIHGVSKVLKCDAPELSHRLAENLAPIIVALGNSYSHILAPSTTFGKNVMPRVAALMDTQQISDISAIHDADTFERPIYAGNAIATVKSSDDKKVITVRGTAFDPVKAEGGNAPIEDVTATGDAGLSKFIKQDFDLIENLADKLGAAVGASRAAVDAGYVPNDYQVGQTGKVVAPELYIAIGISGAIQHLAGMKDSKFIVAINKDEEAPIFNIADFGLVGDLFDVVPELIEKL